MNLDAGSLVASILVSGVGFVVFEYGRRQVRVPQIVAGLTLMGFPYFVPGVGLMALIAVVILVGLFAAVRLGW